MLQGQGMLENGGKGSKLWVIPSSTGLLAAAGPSPGIEALELWPKTSSVKQASNALMAALLATFRSFWKFLFLITSDIGCFFSPKRIFGQDSEKST